MATYLGKKKVKICIENTISKLNLYASTPIVNGIILLSADGHMLKDLNEKFVTAKKEDK
jgi:hypothetical protein